MALCPRSVWSLAGAVVIALAGCGGGSQETSPERDVSTTSTSAPAPAPITTTTPTPPESDPPFSLRLPPGWRDVTALASRQSGLAASGELVLLGRYTGPPVEGLAPNVLVQRAALAPSLPIRVFARRIAGRLESGRRAAVSRLRETELDGAPAVTFSARIGLNSQRQLLAKHAYGGFQIVFTAPAAEFQRYLPDFERIIRSWHWRTG